MDWLAASILATLVVSGGPLLIAEAMTRSGASIGEESATVARGRLRGLRFATVATWAVFGGWFWLDHTAVAAGQRPFVISIANLLAFGILFVAFTGRIMSALVAQRDRADSSVAVRAAVRPLIQDVSPVGMLSAHAFVAVSLALVFIVWSASTNDAGYRAKGLLLLIGGAVLYVLGVRRLRHPTGAHASTTGSDASASGPVAVPRRASRALLAALGCFLLVETSAVLTLTMDFTVRSQRWLGGASQLAVGILGMIVCARMLVDEARRPLETRDDGLTRS